MTIHYAAVLVCALVAFVVSSVYYIIFSKQRAAMLNFEVTKERRPAPWQIGLEIIRTTVLASVFAIVLSHQRHTELADSLKLGLLLWLAFPAVLLSGSVMWDKVPAKLAAIHAGDWLIKLLLIALIIGAWHA